MTLSTFWFLFIITILGSIPLGICGSALGGSTPAPWFTISGGSWFYGIWLIVGSCSKVTHWFSLIPYLGGCRWGCGTPKKSSIHTICAVICWFDYVAFWIKGFNTVVNVRVSIWTISWLLSCIYCLHTAAELLVRLDIYVWYPKPKYWLFRPTLTSDPDPCNGEVMLTTGFENVEAALCKLIITEVGIP